MGNAIYKLFMPFMSKGGEQQRRGAAWVGQVDFARLDMVGVYWWYESSAICNLHDRRAIPIVRPNHVQSGYKWFDEAKKHLPRNYKGYALLFNEPEQGADQDNITPAQGLAFWKAARAWWPQAAFVGPNCIWATWLHEFLQLWRGLGLGGRPFHTWGLHTYGAREGLAQQYTEWVQHVVTDNGFQFDRFWATEYGAKLAQPNAGALITAWTTYFRQHPKCQKYFVYGLHEESVEYHLVRHNKLTVTGQAFRAAVGL